MSTPAEILANVAWRSLSGAHARHSVGDSRARRYAAGFTPIAALAQPRHPDFAALRALAEPGETLYVAGCQTAEWPGFDVMHDTLVHQMTWGGADLPQQAQRALARLDPSHVTDMMALAGRTGLGLWGPRSLELGSYFGVLVDGKLVAMAGTRMQAGTWHEISGVCTCPHHVGTGLGSALVTHLLRGLQASGARAFLHVEHDNHRALALYRRLGFTTLRSEPLKVLRRCDA